MRKLKLLHLRNLLLGFMILSLAASCKKDQKATDAPSDTAQKVDATCECEDSWFPHSQTPNPAEGKGSPFDTASTTNCMFHQWSWQKFLWLTKPDTNNMPLFLTQFSQVSDALIPTGKQAGASVILQYINQAGSNGILKGNPAYGGTDQIDKDYTVYYSIHSNDIMLEAAKKFKDSLTAGTLKPNNLSMFPIGSVELKVSWIDVNTIAAKDRSKFYTTTAAMTKDGKTFSKKTVALLGMHVVGVVINHPEFIWATFQHKDIGPIFDWNKMQAVSEDEKLLYAKGTATDISGITWDSKTNQPGTPLKAFDLFRYGVPRLNGGGFMETAQSEPANFNNVEAINACVDKKLDDVWNNYFYNGSIWLDTDGMTPKEQAELIVSLGYGVGNATPGSSARGSMNNANITMETYTQSFESTLDSINNTNVANCFSCHSGVSFDKTAPKSPLYMSHAFDAYIERNEGKTDQQIEALKNKEHNLRFVKKTLK